MRCLLIILVALSICACSPVTVRTDNGEENNQAPSFQKSYNYWWWGLKGEHSINTREICAGYAVEQMQATYTITDALAGLFTIGIYAPRTARVWCGEAS